MFHFVDISVGRGTDADELWRHWQQLSALGKKVNAIAQQKGDQWRNTQNVGADPDILSALWSEYDDMYRHYQVVSAWAGIMYSLYTFTETGADSPFLHEVMTVASEVPARG